MNPAKLDPMLAKALRDGAGPHHVLIRVAAPLDEQRWAVLIGHGVARSPRPGQTITATLGPAAIAALSDEPWVESIRLTQNLRSYSPA
jgi:hypothetical protein